MEKRTAEVIMVLKGNHDYPTEDNYEAVKYYMADTCDCPLSAYTDTTMFQIIGEASRDYNRCNPTSGMFIFNFLEHLGLVYGDNLTAIISVTHSMASALKMTTVRNKDGEYINGFSEKLCQPIKSIHSQEWFKEE